jgi:1-acyl-sn-glycerol-3-phosphate acyltransferase
VAAAATKRSDSSVISVLRWLLIAIYTLLIGPLICCVALLDRSGRVPLQLGRLWVRSILLTCRVRIEATGLDNLAPLGPALFMPNHNSLADVGIILATLPGPVRFVAKRELVRVPIFGWAMALSGHLIVERGNRAKVESSLEGGAQMLREGARLVVFPEGSRSPEGELARFKGGGFEMALRSGAPLVPVSIVGSSKIKRPSSWRIDGGRVRIHYGEPIHIDSMHEADRAGLKKRMREAILANLDAPAA